MRRAQGRNYNYQMIAVLVLVLLLGFIDGQTCGVDPSVCKEDEKCLYQDGVNACMRQLFSENTTYTLDNATINYFYWVIEKSHTKVTIRMLNQDNITRTLRMGVYTQTSESLEGYPKHYSKVIPSGIGKFEQIHLFNQRFCETQLGQNCLLIIGYSLHSSESIKITISISKGGDEIPILCIIQFGLSMFSLVFFIWVVVKSILDQRKLQARKTKNNLDHFERYIPKQGMSEIDPNYNNEMDSKSCNICIKDIQSYQMARKLLCDHVFHSKCIDNWCSRNLSCPTCRRPLDEKSLKIKSRQIKEKKRTASEQVLTDESKKGARMGSNNIKNKKNC